MRSRRHRLFLWIGLALAAWLSVSPAVVASADGNGQLWQFKTGDIVYAAATSADGALTVVGSRDSNAYAFDRTGKRLWTYATRNAVTAVTVSPKGAYVAVASADSTLTLLTRSGHDVWKQSESGPHGAVGLTAGARRVAYGVNNTSEM